MNVTHVKSLMDQESMDVPLGELRVGGAPVPPKADGPDAFGTTESGYGGERQNSRSLRTLPAGTWKLNWKAEMASGFPPWILIGGAKHIAIQAGKWQVFDRQGKPLGSGRAGSGPLVLDEAAGLVYFVDNNGILSANQVTDGKRRFMSLLPGGEDAAYNLLIRTGEEFLLAGFRMPRADFEQLNAPTRDAPRASTLALLHKISIGNPPRLGAGGLVLGAKELTLRLNASRLVGARNGKTIAFAVGGALFFTAADLQVQNAYATPGAPASISIDESNRVHLVLKRDEKYELWVVTPEGRLAYSHRLPVTSDRMLRPVAIGFDHAAYVSVDNLILAIGPDGKQRWRAEAAGKPGGMLITPAGTLVVSEGSQLNAYDAIGKRTTLCDLKESLLTPPLLTADGEFFAASEKHLFCVSTAA